MDLTVCDTKMMRLALEQAEAAATIGEVPVGAVVYRGDEILATAHNMREHWADPTAHAELIALREAAKKIGTWRLDGCRLAVTLEPCPMCAGALVNSRLEAVVYGITDPNMGCVESLHHLLDTEAFNHRVQWQGGVLADECLALLRAFFKVRRGADKPPKPTPGPWSTAGSKRSSTASPTRTWDASSPCTTCWTPKRSTIGSSGKAASSRMNAWLCCERSSRSAGVLISRPSRHRMT